jgi:hypothetical protein
MITSSIVDVPVVRLSPEAELRLILFLFLYPAIWGAVLAVIAVFKDLKQALTKKKTTGRDSKS